MAGSSDTRELTFLLGNDYQSFAENSNQRSRYQTGVRWVNHETLLTRAIASCISGSDQRAAIRAEAFSAGATSVLFKLWPTVFFGLLLYDYIQYFLYPRERYQTTALDIFLGTATNQITITSQFGSDLVTHVDYLLWPSLLAALPLLMGMANLLRRWHWHKTLSEREINQLLTTLQRAVNESGYLPAALPFSNVEFALSRISTALRWDRNLSDASAEKLFTAVSDLAQQGSGLVQLQAISALNYISDAASFKQQTINQLRILSRHVQVSGIVATLRAIPRQLVAHYVTWSSGNNHKVLPQLLWLLPLYIGFANVRLWELWITKIVGIIDYYQDQQSCEADGKRFAYSERIGNYLCSICDDWSSVYPTSINDAQACLNGFLTQQQTPSAIVTVLKRLATFAHDITTLNFSQQNWLSWNVTDFATVLTHLQPFNQLQRFNFSYVNQMPEWLPDNKLDLLQTYLNQTQVLTLDVSYLALGNDRAVSLLGSLRNSNLTALNLCANQLDDDCFAELLPILPRTLRYFNAAYNAVGNRALQYLNATLTTSNWEVLDLSYNGAITPEGLLQLTTGFTQSNLRSLNIAGITQNITSIAHISQYQPVTLQLLDLSGSQLTDTAIAALQPANLTTLIVNNNFLTDDGFAQFVDSISHSALEVIAAANNQLLGDARVCQSLQALQSLRDLNLSGNDLSMADYPTLSQLLIQLQRVDLTKTNYSNEALQQLIVVIQQGASRLRYVNLSNNQLDANAISAIEQLFVSNMTGIDLSNNLINTSVAERIAARLSNQTCQLTQLDLSQTPIGVEGINALIRVWPESPLQRFMYDGNVVTSVNFPSMIKALIAEPWPDCLLEVGNVCDSLDDVRALQRVKPGSSLRHVSMKGNQFIQVQRALLDRLAPPLDFAANQLDVAGDGLDFPDFPINQQARRNIFLQTLESHSNSGPWAISFSNQNNHSVATNDAYQNSNYLLAAGSLLPLFGAVFLLALLARAIWPRLRTGLPESSSSASEARDHRQQLSP